MNNSIEKTFNKWNIIYSTIFVVSSGFLVDIWAGFATITLFIVAILVFIAPYLATLARWLNE